MGMRTRSRAHRGHHGRGGGRAAPTPRRSDLIKKLDAKPEAPAPAPAKSRRGRSVGQ